MSPVRILLLEDSEIDADLMLEQLERGSHAFTLKRVVAEAEFRAALAAGEIDLILSDYSLPSFDGRQALELAHALLPDVPFIFVSGVLGEEVAIESLQRGATDYVLKHRLARLPAAVSRAVIEMRERRERRRAQEQLEESLVALQHSDEALRALNESLERRVEERTQELAAVNRDLRAQIEERERVEATLGQMQRLEAVGQLTSGLAHDFNNLLTVVLGNLNFVEQSAGAPEVSRHLAHMRSAAERGASLTEQLLAFSRRQKLEPKPTDLAERVADMRELLQSTMDGGIRVRTSIEPGLWPALVDPNQIELVILNLAINARDAMPDGGDLMVETSNIRIGDSGDLRDMPAPGDYIELSVSDTGTGMSEAVLAHAFEPFYTTKEIGKGSGLGLAQVYGFAKQSGGSVRIDSTLGRGSSIRVFLPRATAPVAAPAPPRAAAPARTGKRPPTILLVDDDSDVRWITGELLTGEGYTVVQAASGASALDILAKRREIDLMLADLAMPGMNGMELARQASEARPGLPMLFVTGYAHPTALAALGEDRIIRKPYRNQELTTKLQQLLAEQ
jgi:signal transduction histidine kinase